MPAGVTDLIYPRRYYITQQPSSIQVVGGGGSEKGEIEVSDWLGGGVERATRRAVIG